ncbi:hypothetical protein QYE76_033066 [Lolium multiflorum]|uniref:Reverse transcriptase domain-containing protein n=1 Tax=Lolium multiflorum TaxID=4521 RepID=A0AAD8VLY7_LOLMU|nr:hypothetical protein QYE76_033066 [Lolium multiflorum]
MKLHTTDFNCLVNHAESIGRCGARVGTTVNVHAFMAKHKALGIHLRNLQASHRRYLEAFLDMNRLSSPGPDGFGPSFFQTFWDTVCSDVVAVFSSFYEGTIDLTRINRAFLVLLPKTDAANTPTLFRPISLQNCIMKAITKVLTTRLQATIHSLVDADQTGFLSGRRISENIVYTADILHCLHLRKAPTLVFKIDFRKAFDFVNWDSFLAILKVRGFDDRWCEWMARILTTSHTAVLLYGVPGDWIRCHNGLRPGDPLSRIFSSLSQMSSNALSGRPSTKANFCTPSQPPMIKELVRIGSQFIGYREYASRIEEKLAEANRLADDLAQTGAK